MEQIYPSQYVISLDCGPLFPIPNSTYSKFYRKLL